MNVLNLAFLLLCSLLCTDLCSSLFWTKGLKSWLHYGKSYNRPYRSPYGYPYYNNYGYYGGYGGGSASYYRPNRRVRGQRTGRTYSDIARVINPNPYAFVGSRPYPGQPFWG